MFRIKMTAVRTNPQQIREVRIDSEKTVGELLELVRIVYEYGDVRGSLLNEAGASPRRQSLRSGSTSEIS